MQNTPHNSMSTNILDQLRINKYEMIQYNDIG